MDKVKKMLKSIAEYKKRYDITENSSTAEKLVYELSKKHNTNNEYLELQKKVKFFWNQMHQKKISKWLWDILNH